MTTSGLFRSTGWQLALLNAAVATFVVVVTSGATLLLIRSWINDEADNALTERIEVAEIAWRDVLISGSTLSVATPVTTPLPEQASGDEPGESASDDLLESGDSIIFVFDRTGRLIGNPRNVVRDGLPSQAGVERALAGDADARTVELGDELRARVHTEPVIVHGDIVGAIQAVRGQELREAELRRVEWASLIGIGLGALLAISAGVFLARRAMRPVADAFAREQAFVADASHELRTPLTIIRANLELIQRLPNPSSREVRDELSEVIAEIDSTSRLVDDLLLLARADNAALTLNAQSVDLRDLALDTVDSLTGRATGAGITLAVHGNVSATVRGDADRLRQVLRIVLDNAMTYTSAGGTITVTIELHAGSVLVTVRDNGIGMTPEDQSHAFDRFYRADHARSRATGGAGLGLAIAKAIITGHGGAISLDSEQGKGTTVRISLPRDGHDTI